MCKDLTVFESVIINSLEIPGIKVNRDEFLMNILSRYENDKSKIYKAIDTNPVEAGFSQQILDKSARYSINKTTALSSGASFLAGLPGGLTMIASIPADVLQYLAMSIRLAQEIAYIYGEKDLYSYIESDDPKVREILTGYIGVMFGVQGASEIVKFLSSQLSKTALKKIPQKALTKTFYYPIIKKIGATLSIKVTKNSFAKSISKAIPVVGGVVSGTITFFSLKPMGKKLQECLSESKFNYTEVKADLDVKRLESMYENKEVIDIKYKEISTIRSEHKNLPSNTLSQSNTFKISQEIKNLKEIISLKLVTQEEATKIKDSLLEETRKSMLDIKNDKVKYSNSIDIVKELKETKIMLDNGEIDISSAEEKKTKILNEYYGI